MSSQVHPSSVRAVALVALAALSGSCATSNGTAEPSAAALPGAPAVPLNESVSQTVCDMRASGADVGTKMGHIAGLLRGRPITALNASEQKELRLYIQLLRTDAHNLLYGTTVLEKALPDSDRR